MTAQQAIERIQASNPETRNVITLKRSMLEWVAVYSGPHAEDIKALFDMSTAVLPTAFTPTTDSQTVLAEIRRLNPDVDVRLA